METNSDDWDDWDDPNQSQDAVFHFDQSQNPQVGQHGIFDCSFMEDVQIYECLYNNFNKQYKNKFVCFA